jgi:hypothetical protein
VALTASIIHRTAYRFHVIKSTAPPHKLSKCTKNVEAVSVLRELSGHEDTWVCSRSRKLQIFKSSEAKVSPLLT